MTQTTETTEEQKKLEQREGEAGFNAGFKKAGGAEEQQPEKKATEAGTQEGEAESTDAGASAETEEQKTAREAAEAKAKQDAEAKAAEEERWKGVPSAVRETLSAIQADSRRSAEETAKRMRNLEGHIGGLKSQVESSLAAAKAATEKKGGEAPTDAAVQAALSDPEAWKRLKDDFPDWAGPVEKEFAAIRAEIAKAKPGTSIDVNALKQELKAEVRAEVANEAVEDAFPGWRQTVQTAEFSTWLKGQPESVRNLTSSDRPRDALTVLNGFKQHKEAAAAKATADEAARQRQQRRVEGAVVPQGSGAPLETGISDDAAFERGFKRAEGK